MPPSGINTFVEELFERAGLEVQAQNGGVAILDVDGNTLGEGRNLPLAIQGVKGRNFMKYGQVFGLAMAYAFGPEGVVTAVFALQRADIDDLLDEEEGILEEEEEEEADDVDGEEEEEEEEEDDADPDSYDDSNDIQDGRIRFVEEDED